MTKFCCCGRIMLISIRKIEGSKVDFESGMVKKRVIPPKNRDLRRYVLRRRLLQLSGYLLWLAVFWFGAQGYNNSHQTYSPDRLILGWKLAVWMLAAAIVGFFLFRLWRFITQRGMEGQVEKSGLAHSYTSSGDPGGGNSVNYDFRLHTRLVVRDSRGKRRRLRFEQKAGFYLYYYPGTQVCRLSGLPYPIRNPEQTGSPREEFGQGKTAHDDLSNGYLCAACGNLNNHSLSEPCGLCGYSLVDPAELWRCGENKATDKGEKLLSGAEQLQRRFAFRRRKL